MSIVSILKNVYWFAVELQCTFIVVSRERHYVSNNWQIDWLPNSLCRRAARNLKYQSFTSMVLCEVTGRFPSQRDSNAESIKPCHDVIMVCCVSDSSSRSRRSAAANRTKETYSVAVATKGCRAYDPDFDAWVASGRVVSVNTSRAARCCRDLVGHFQWWHIINLIGSFVSGAGPITVTPMTKFLFSVHTVWQDLNLNVNIIPSILFPQKMHCWLLSIIEANNDTFIKAYRNTRNLFWANI